MSTETLSTYRTRDDFACQISGNQLLPESKRREVTSRRRVSSPSGKSLPPNQIYTNPFSKCRLHRNPKLKMWYYLDEARKVQGPFTSVQMDFWFMKGYLFNELLIGFRQTGPFLPLLDFLQQSEFLTKNSSLRVIFKTAAKSSRGSNKHRGRVAISAIEPIKEECSDDEDDTRLSTQTQSNEGEISPPLSP